MRSRIESGRQSPMATRRRGTRILSFSLDNVLESLSIRFYPLIIFLSKLVSWIRVSSESDKRTGPLQKLRKRRNEPSSTINVWTSLRKELSSLLRIDESSGSPDPRTLAKYEARMVEMPPRTATAVPTCMSNSSKRSPRRGRLRERPYVCSSCSCNASGHRTNYDLYPNRSVNN